jgi:hypothetical protein
MGMLFGIMSPKSEIFAGFLRACDALQTGLDPHRPMPIGTAQKIYSHAKLRAEIIHGQGIHTLRRVWMATPVLVMPARCVALRKAPWTLVRRMEEVAEELCL